MRLCDILSLVCTARSPAPFVSGHGRRYRDDIDLMFKNAKKFNIPDSPIYVAARAMQAFLHREIDRCKTLGVPKFRPKAEVGVIVAEEEAPLPLTVPTLKVPFRFPPKVEVGEAIRIDPVAIAKKLDNAAAQLYEAAKTAEDEDGRELCEIFMKLPSKQEWPDYYEVIKTPIDMLRINRRIKSRTHYTSLSGVVADFDQMFVRLERSAIPCAYA